MLAGLSALMVLLAAVIYSRRCVLVSSLRYRAFDLPVSASSLFDYLFLTTYVIL